MFFHSGGVYCWVTWRSAQIKYELNSIKYLVFDDTFQAYKSPATLIEQAGGLDGRRAGFHENSHFFEVSACKHLSRWAKAFLKFQSQDVSINSDTLKPAAVTV